MSSGSRWMSQGYSLGLALTLLAAAGCGGKTQSNQDEPSPTEPAATVSAVRLLLGREYVDVLDSEQTYRRVWGSIKLDDHEGIVDATAGSDGVWLFSETSCEYILSGLQSDTIPFPLCPNPRNAVNRNNRRLVTCALHDGVTNCQGVMESPNELEVDSSLLQPPDTVFSSISPSRFFACGIRRDNAHPECFRIREDAGLNQVFESDQWRSAPAEALSVAQTTTTFACGLTQEGEVRCWGALGDMSPNGNPQPWGGVQDRRIPFPGLIADRLVARSWAICARSADTHGLSCINVRRIERPVFDPSVAYTDFDGMFDGGCALREADNKIDCWGSYSTADFDDQSYAGNDLPYR